MFSSRAYSFRQKSRLAISLSWVAGYTNVVSLLAMGTLVSHVTGTATQLGRGLGEGNFAAAAFFGHLLISFMAGAVLSAYLTENAKRRGWRSKYMLPIGLETLLLALLAIHLATRGRSLSGLPLYEAVGMGSIAMGLQNATITKISGAVVRTTHLSGIFTDLGLEGVQYLFWWGDQLAKRRRERAGRLLKVSRRHPPFLRLLLLLSIAASFGLGAVAGTLIFSVGASMALFVPVLFLMGIMYLDWRKPIADIRELDLLSDPELSLYGIITQLLPRGIVIYRASCLRGGGMAHRAPNFQLWVDRVPERCQVFVLALSSLTRFDANAVMDLDAAVRRLHAEKKKLILSGITAHQFKALDALGVARTMDVSNICPDLEFAIARAMVLLEDMSPRASLRPQLAAG